MKKKLFSLSLLLLAASALVACSDDDDDRTPRSEYDVVSFESGLTDPYGDPVVLGKIDLYASGVISYSKDWVFWPKSYAVETDDYDQYFWQGPYIYALDGAVMLGAYYDDGTLWDYANGEKVTDTWGGFVLSQHAGRPADKSGWELQFDAWAAQGADGTKTFAVGYDSNTAGAGWMPAKDYNAPQIDFTHAVKPASAYLANSAYTYTYFTGAEGDSFAVEITGWLNGVQGMTIACKLIDGASKVADWTKVDLTTLGEVDKLTFKVVASDPMAPCYFCFDELALMK